MPKMVSEFSLTDSEWTAISAGEDFVMVSGDSNVLVAVADALADLDAVEYGISLRTNALPALTFQSLAPKKVFARARNGTSHAVVIAYYTA